MNNVIKFDRPKPKAPEPKKPTGPRKLTWEPWAGFLVLALVVYAFQFHNPLG